MTGIYFFGCVTLKSFKMQALTLSAGLTPFYAAGPFLDIFGCKTVDDYSV